MYPKDKKIKAVELWLKYDKCESDVIKELGYPSYKMLSRWYEELQHEAKTGLARDSFDRYSKYTKQQKEEAVKHYFENGKRFSRTIRALGYPSRNSLLRWCEEVAPRQRKTKSNAVEYSHDQKVKAVVTVCSGQGNAKEVSETLGTSRATLKKWQRELLGEENSMANSEDSKPILPNDKDQLISEIDTLKRQVGQLRMEKDILEAAAELIKKDQGVDLKKLSNREKTVLIGALKSKYMLKDLFKELFLPKSSYHYQFGVMSSPDKYEQLSIRIVELFEANNSCYGYRRIHKLLASEGRVVSEKIVRRIMKAQELVAIAKRKRKYNSYQGEISPAPDNLVKRDFHSEKPNSKWLTDITEFHIPAGKIYLSPIVDCFDGMLVSWTISTRPDAEMVNSMLDLAADKLSEEERPIVHSDRGSHYRWPGWIERIAGYDLTQSMSKKGCSPDNAACEGLFGRIKNEMFYNRSWKNVSLDSFIDILDRYLYWYNNLRIKMSLNGMSPVNYRLSLGLSP